MPQQDAVHDVDVDKPITAADLGGEDASGDAGIPEKLVTMGRRTVINSKIYAVRDCRVVGTVVLAVPAPLLQRRWLVMGRSNHAVTQFRG
jgi:hypothetical protein